MSAQPAPYAAADLIPFTAEVYLRLFERQNEWLWPAHPLAFLLGAAALGLAWRGNGRGVAIILALTWVWVAWSFHLRLYTELTWAANYLGAAMFVQATLMLGCGFFSLMDRRAHFTLDIPAMLGWALALFGLLGFPLLAPLIGHGWSGAQLFGVAPAPTIITTLGLLLLIARPLWVLMMLPIPLLLLALSGVVTRELDLSLAWIAPLTGALALLAAIGLSLRRTSPPAEQHIPPTPG